MNEIIRKCINNYTKVKESYTEDEPNLYTIWSASDLVESSKQIPLVKVKFNDDGTFEVIALSDSEFDQDSYKIALNSLNASMKAGKSIKDALNRLDKTINHNDPFFATEIDRSVAGSYKFDNYDSIIDITDFPWTEELELVYTDPKTNKTKVYTVNDIDKLLNKKKLSKKNTKIIYTDPKTGEKTIYTIDDFNKYFSQKDLDEEDEEKKTKYHQRSINPTGIELLAANALITIRDDLKAVITKKGVTEDDVANKYQELTGVNYYTNEIENQDQYNALLGLLLKDPKNDYVSPEENDYLINLRNLTDDLIEKVLLKNDPDFFKYDK